MTLTTLDSFISSYLHMKDFPNDISLNGVQVQNSQPDTKEISKIAFAVDACLDTIIRAHQAQADMLFVHHGLFWGHEQSITGIHYTRIKELITADIALYACHLPLDAHTEIGHNYALAKQIGLTNLQPFGVWKNTTIGVKGEFSTPCSIDRIIKDMFTDGAEPMTVLPFGNKDIRTAGIICGGGAREVEQAIDQNLDLYITGETKHESYHVIMENKISLIAGGHYETEKLGLKLLMEKINKETNISCVFIESPTGL